MCANRFLPTQRTHPSATCMQERRKDMEPMIVDDDINEDPSFDKPVPRPAKTPAQLARIQTQNRRREYLERNPTYYDDLDHELADPLLYERLVRNFQTHEEKQVERQAKGYARILEADLARSQQRQDTSTSTSIATPTDGDEAHEDRDSPRVSARPSSNGDGGGEAWDETPVDAQHARSMWREFLRERFVRGDDADFDYAPVDASDDLDGQAARDAQQDWFDDEEPGWDGSGADDDDGEDEGEGVGRRLHGETGVQDF